MNLVLLSGVLVGEGLKMGYNKDEFSEDEKKIVSPFFTNLDKQVFVLKNIPQVVAGTLFSRYSRSAKPLRRLLLEDFIDKPEMGFDEIVGQKEGGTEEIIAIKKAEEFYDRVLVDFGDDSVAELGGAHVGCEQVSNIAAKALEDSRIGISPLEKSTRYIYFHKKVGGNYQYYRPEKIMNSEFAKEYERLCDELFGVYEENLDKMKECLMKKFPQTNDLSDRAYNSTIKAKVCDVLRVFLPAGTLTNLGLYGNGRAFEYLITKMKANELEEVRSLGNLMQEELSKVIPSFVKRATEEDVFGKGNISFLREINAGMKKLAKETVEGIESDSGQEVVLVKYDEDAVEKVLAGMIYPYTDLSFEQVFEKVKGLNEKERKKLIDVQLSGRRNRRHKPGRGFELANYTFDILGNYGIYRDLQRHRMLTQQKQDLTVKHGFDVPEELELIGLTEKYKEMMKKVEKFYWKIFEKFPKEAQYVVPFGYKIRWHITINARALYHFVELRSVAAGHSDYRIIAQKMYLKAKAVHPTLFEWAKFVDLKNYDLERVESEKGIDRKIEVVKKKYEKQRESRIS